MGLERADAFFGEARNHPPTPESPPSHHAKHPFRLTQEKQLPISRITNPQRRRKKCKDAKMTPFLTYFLFATM